MPSNGPQVNIVRRQILGSALGGVGSIVSGVGSGVNSALSGVGAGVSSGLGDITSAINPASTTSTTSSVTSTSTTHTSSTPQSSSSSSPSSLSSSSISISTLPSSSTSSSTSSVPSSTTTFTSSTPSSTSSVYISTSDGVPETITAFVTQPTSPTSSPTQTSSSSGAVGGSGFLSNKPLEGFIFALCGLVGLVIIFVVATFAIRRSRRRKMINEALSYEPTTTHGFIDEERSLTEKVRNSFNSTGSSRSGNYPNAGAPMSGGYGQQAAYGYPVYPTSTYDASRNYGSSYTSSPRAPYHVTAAPQPINNLPTQANFMAVSQASAL